VRLATSAARAFAVLPRGLCGSLELDVALLRGGDQCLDGLGVLFEVGNDGALLQGQEVVADGCGPGQLTAAHGERALDVLLGRAQPLGDRGRRQSEQRELVDGFDLLDVGQRGPVLVLVPLTSDPVSVVVVLGSGDDHRHQGLRGLDRAEGAAVAVADTKLPVLGAHGHDRLDHAVVFDGGHEVLVQLGLADVQVDQQRGRVDHFERRFDGRRHG